MTAIAQGCQRVGCLSGLADKHCWTGLRQHRFTIAEFRCDIGLERQFGFLFKPVFRCVGGIIRCATGNRHSPISLGEHRIGHVAQIERLRCLVDIGQDRARERFRLFVNFLQHEMIILAALNQAFVHSGFHAGTVYAVTICIAHIMAGGRQYDPIALFQISDIAREGSQRDSV